LIVLSDRKVDWERFGRARKLSSPEILELNNWRANLVRFDVASYYCQALIHRAHTVMLAEEGIIKKHEAVKIIDGVKEVEKMAEGHQDLVGYMSTETALIELIGDIGGKMHIARSRNDLGHTQRRMYYRDQVERVIESLINFREKLLSKSEKNLETVMPGYTHWRQAQPITLAHYLLAHVDAAGRSIKRLEGVYKRTNISPLGSAAFAGTGWEINRYRTMDLLGFDDLCENTHDGVAAIDYYMEFASAICIHMSNLSRLAEDLQLWSSDEFQLIDLDEAYAGTSSIMPQKKNPTILEQVKSYAAESIGNMVSIVSSMKGTSYTNIRERIMLEPVSIDTAVGSTKVMAGVVETLIPLNDNMLKHLNNGFSTMTELADTLVRLQNISFRQAHDIIVNVTLRCLTDGIKASEITPMHIRKASKKVLGKALEIKDADLQNAVNPVLNVRRRKVIGGPAPESVKKMIKARWSEIEYEKKDHELRTKKLLDSNKKLESAENSLI
jgi:argininosuccinate lyase